MEERYTMEEFKQMFNEAEAKAMEEMCQQLGEAEERVVKDSMFTSMLMMQNMIFGATIAKYLFKKN